jgi:dTDP-4-dehydrorhamnose 3,5-epimerase
MTVVEIRPLDLDGLLEIKPRRFADQRGFFSEVWREEWLSDAGVQVEFVQDNHSFSRQRGVLRGMHFQVPPAAQDKLVRVARGAIFDVAVDIRRQSASFGRWTGIILSAEEWNQLFVPKGFAHGFVTLEDDTEVLYKTTAPYAGEHDRSISFADPAIGIDWPVEPSNLFISDKDKAASLLSEVDTGF